HPLPVRVGQGVEHLVDVRERLASRDATLLHTFCKVLTFHEFHDHHELIFQLQRGSQLRDIGMIQRCQNLDFPLEASCQVLTTHETRKQNFNGLATVGNHMAYAVHSSHPATAELPDDLVIADSLLGPHIQLSRTERNMRARPSRTARARPQRASENMYQSLLS